MILYLIIILSRSRYSLFITARPRILVSSWSRIGLLGRSRYSLFITRRSTILNLISSWSRYCLLIVIRLLVSNTIWSPWPFWLEGWKWSSRPIQLCIRILSLSCSCTIFRITSNISLHLISLLVSDWSITMCLSLITSWSMTLCLISCRSWYSHLITSRSRRLIVCWSMSLNLCRSWYCDLIVCWSSSMTLSLIILWSS